MHAQYTPEQIEQFWSQADQSGGPDACWPFQGRLHTHGYGRPHINGREVYAHRLAYELTFGPIPAGLDVLHHCDNPPCCNPSHFFLGTQTDNNIDRNRKGRNVPPPRFIGDRHPNAKLTDVAAAEIRRRYVQGVRYHDRDNARELAAEFGVSVSSIRMVMRRESWKHVT